MHSLNRQRANIVFSNLIDRDLVLTPELAAKRERIFERDGVLRWHDSIVGRCSIGVSTKELIRFLGYSESTSASFRSTDDRMTALLDIFQAEQYVLYHDQSRRQACIILKKGASATSSLKAWSHALVVARQGNNIGRHYESGDNVHAALRTQEKKKLLEREGAMTTDTFEPTLDVMRKTLLDHSAHFSSHMQRLKAAGWDVDTAALETRPAFRFALDD